MLSFQVARQVVHVLLVLSLFAGMSTPHDAWAIGQEAGAGQLAADIVSAGRLRTQSQRLAKLYQQAGMGLSSTHALQQIDASVSELNAEFGRLGAFPRRANVQRALARCEILWTGLRAALKQLPGPESSERVNQLADELMIQAGKLSMLIEAEGETPVGRLIDLSSRLNMLSQRLARLYLLAQGDSRAQGILVDIEQARTEFSTGLNELDTARENTPASRDALGLARNQWVFFDSAINRLAVAGRGDGRAMQNVVTSSERIAQVLDLASSQYARDYAAAARPGR